MTEVTINQFSRQHDGYFIPTKCYDRNTKKDAKYTQSK